MEERDVRSIDVLGSRLLLTDEVPFVLSELLFREITGSSRLLGRYEIDSRSCLLGPSRLLGR